MSQPQPRYALSHESYQRDICRGLSNLQQNGEYVDMTLAADGHLVKVHKIILSLASPYFKDIINSADGQHPMIYLNKVTYPVLTAILEYIYTGQTHVEANNLDEFVQVTKDLHISGLTDLDFSDNLFNQVDPIKNQHEEAVAKMLAKQKKVKSDEPAKVTYVVHTEDNAMETVEEYYEVTDHQDNEDENQTFQVQESQPQPIELSAGPENKALYTVSNQGTIQMIFNRYVYALSYLYLKKPGFRKWRCVEAKEHKCPAIIVTEENRVIKRQRAHNHPFHDKRILKRMKDRAVFTAISDLKKAFDTKPEEHSGSENE